LSALDAAHKQDLRERQLDGNYSQTMSTPSGQLKVLTGDDFACVKISGRANFTLGIDFQSLLGEVQKRDYSIVVMDLTDCLLMDSTFLGILTGFGLKMSQPNGSSKSHVVELLNPNVRVAELLENLGVIQLFTLRHGTNDTPCVEQTTPSLPAPNQQQLTRACLEAHQTLMAMSADNATKFKDVAQFLSEELKKTKTAA
jgi:anti-sigma B factor antagonist